MKRILAALLALALAMTAALALADVPGKPVIYAHAYDFSGDIFRESTMLEINRIGGLLEEKTGNQVIAVVVDDLGGMEAGKYATEIINSWGIGSENNDGAVILLAIDDREIFVGTGIGLDGVMPSSKCGELIDQSIGLFADNRFDKGMMNLYEDVCRYLAAAQGVVLGLEKETSNYAYDFGELTLSRKTIETINEYGALLEDMTGIQLIASFIDGTDETEMAEYLLTMSKLWGFGDGKDTNAAIILISWSQNSISIGQTELCRAYLSDEKCRELEAKYSDLLSKENYDDVMLGLYVDTCNILAQEQGNELDIKNRFE